MTQANNLYIFVFAILSLTVVSVYDCDKHKIWILKHDLKIYPVMIQPTIELERFPFYTPSNVRKISDDIYEINDSAYISSEFKCQPLFKYVGQIAKFKVLDREANELLKHNDTEVVFIYPNGTGSFYYLDGENNGTVFKSDNWGLEKKGEHYFYNKKGEYTPGIISNPTLSSRFRFLYMKSVPQPYGLHIGEMSWTNGVLKGHKYTGSFEKPSLIDNGGYLFHGNGFLEDPFGGIQKGIWENGQFKNNHTETISLDYVGKEKLTWTKKSSYPGGGRHHPITFANSTHGFLLTGSYRRNHFSYPYYGSDFYTYNVENDSWIESEVKFEGEARSYGCGLVQDGNAYFGFGYNGSRYLDDWWKYDMKLEQFTRLTDLPGIGRVHPAIISVPGKIYVGLGNAANLNNLADFWEYDIKNDSWTQISNFPGTARHHPFYFSVNNTLFVGLGHSSRTIYPSTTAGIERDWYKYENGNWSRLNDFESYGKSGKLITSEGRVAGTQGTIDECGLSFILSGNGDDHSWMKTGEFHIYKPSTDSWMAMPPHPGFSRWAPGSFVIGKRMFFTSGKDEWEDEYNNDLWEINLESFC